MTDEDRLRDLFRRESEAADAGFTLRVLAALPRGGRRTRVRLAVLLSACMVGAVISLGPFGAGGWLTEALPAVLSDPRRHWPALVGFFILAATALLAAGGVHDSD